MIRKRISRMELPVEEIAGRAKENDAIRLDIGQPSFDTPEHVKQAAVDSIDERQGYTPPSGFEGLRREIAAEESMKSGIEFEAEEVLVAVGGMGALFTVLASRLNHDDTLLVNSPFWTGYRMMSAVNGNRVESVEYFDGYGELTDSVHERAADAEVMLVNTPSNPAGRVLDEEQARALAELSEDSGCYLVSDEVYWRMTYGGEHVSPVAFAEDAAVIGSVSKNHAMTGWRIGWVADSEESVEQYRKVSRGVNACPSRIGQRAAEVALREDSEVEQMRESYRERAEIVAERCRDLGWELERPEGAFYAFPDIGSDGWDFCLEAVEEAGVALVPGEPFGEEFVENVRISFGSVEKGELREAFDRLDRRSQ